MKIFVFVGQFSNRESATKYTEPFYEPQPSDDVSDEEYNAWEDRNPIFQMATDLNCYLDSDFIETITDGDKAAYLKSMIKEPHLIDSYGEQLNQKNNAMVLIFEDAINSDSYEFKETPRLKYLGSFEGIR